MVCGIIEITERHRFQILSINWMAVTGLVKVPGPSLARVLEQLATETSGGVTDAGSLLCFS
jgi:hypothetical protein